MRKKRNDRPPRHGGVVDLDADLANADWTKQSWDLLGFENADQFRAWLKAQGMTVEEFKRLPAWTLAKDKPEWAKEP